MSSSRRASRLAMIAAALLAVVAACTPGATSSDDDDGSAVDGPPLASVTIPPVRLTPFCQAMIDLGDRLERDPPDDIEAEIIETYEAIADEVPAAIREDFDAVLADLRGEASPPGTDADTPDTPATTDAPAPPQTDAAGASLPPGDAFFDEGYDPDDDPALRLNTYVDFECRDVANNPGPPATQPLTEPETTGP